MGRFQSTISTVAALASIFGAGAAGWKLASDNAQPPSESREAPKAEERTALVPTPTLKESVPQLPELPPQPVQSTVVAPPPVGLPSPPEPPPVPVDEVAQDPSQKAH